MKDALIRPNANLTSSISYFRYVATELATDMVVSVGDVKFYVHKVYSFQSVTKFCFFFQKFGNIKILPVSTRLSISILFGRLLT